MKIAMLILGIIGALSALGGSVMTLIAGVAGTAAGSIADKSDVAMEGARVFWAGAFTVAIGGFALVTSIIGGVAKSRNAILTMGISTLVAGLLNAYLFNWISGGLLTIAGLLGMIGSKEGTDKEVSIFKSVIFYLFMICIIIFTALAMLLRSDNVTKNDKSINVDPSKPVAVETLPTPTVGPEVLNGKWSGWGGNTCQDPITFNSDKLALSGTDFDPIEITTKTPNEFLVKSKSDPKDLGLVLTNVTADSMKITSLASGDNFVLARCK